MTAQCSKTVDLIINQLNEAEFFFRVGMDASANNAFSSAIDNLLKNINHYSHEKLMELNNILKSALKSQEESNWIGLADTIKYSLLPTIHTIR